MIQDDLKNIEFKKKNKKNFYVIDFKQQKLLKKGELLQGLLPITVF